jgi:hypothetical protein
VALYRLARACCMVAVALCWAPLAVSTARAEDGTQDRIAVGTLVCAEQAAANDVMAILHDPDAEDPVRRLTLILSSGECSDLWVGETYQPVEIERSGIVKARVRGFSNAYLVPLIASREVISTR